MYKKLKKELKDLTINREKYIFKIGEDSYRQISVVYNQRLEDIQSILDIYVKFLIEDKSNDLKERNFAGL